eukprot:3490356-Amphidinium_carterae.1
MFPQNINADAGEALHEVIKELIALAWAQHVASRKRATRLSAAQAGVPSPIRCSKCRCTHPPNQAPCEWMTARRDTPSNSRCRACKDVLPLACTMLPLLRIQFQKQTAGTKGSLCNCKSVWT